jgi:L-fucose isomerase-like protein
MEVMKSDSLPTNREAGRRSVQLPKLGVTTEILTELLPPLSAAKPTRVLVLGCGVKIHFPWEKACCMMDSAVARVEGNLPVGPFDVVRAPEPYEDPAAMIAFLDQQLAGGIDGIVFFHAAFTAGEIGSQFGRWLLDHPTPVLSWSFPDEPAERLESNSLCSQNFLLNMWQRLEVKFVWLHGPVDDSADAVIARFGRSVRARARFKHGRALDIGGSRVPAFYDGETDELAVMRRFGLRFDRIDLEAAFQHARKFKDTDLKRLRDAIINSPHCAANDVPDTQIYQTLRLGLAALDMAAEGGYVGCTIKSWPELFDQYGCATDGSVSMLNDFGLCTTEEGEMNGLLSSLAMQFLSEGDAVPTMMDLSALKSECNRIGIWHCGASATRWLKSGTKYEAHKHSILENADPETAVGLMLEFLLELGPATVLRYQSPDAASAFAFEGELVETPLPFRGTYCELEPKAPHRADQIMGTILGCGLDHHWSLGFGHWKDDLAMFHHWLGVEDIAIRHDGGNHGMSRAR